MKRWFLFILTILVFCISCKNKKESNLAKSSLKDRLESYLNTCDENGLSASILVVKDEEILYGGEVAQRSKVKNSLITKETIFTIGSVTKQFTATAILKLQEEGKLSVTDSISLFFKIFLRISKT